MAIFRDVTPDVEPVSIDEAFLDVTGAVADVEAARRLACRIKDDLRRKLGLTGSVGIGPNKFLAKLASDLRKPDGLTVAPAEPEAVRDFLAGLPTQRIWGVGPATAEILERRGLRTIGDLQRRPLADLERILGASLGLHVHRLAFGLDDRPVESGPQEEKSISHEETFAHDVADRETLRRVLLVLTEKVGRRLRQSGRIAGTLQLKLRYADFRTITRQLSLQAPTSADRDLLRAAAQLLDRQDLPQAVRLIGVGVTGLRDPAEDPARRQLRLFEDDDAVEDRRNTALDSAVDSLRERFGERILRRGHWGKPPG
jgi:DNA polymerase-4